MSEDSCRNDCAVPLRFPRRPGTRPPAVHGEGCPCCVTSRDRISDDNRPALSRFNYRIGTYGSIREFLFDRIDSTSDLQAWTYRAPDDPAVALLEGASILGDILTFYQEAYANEAFLRTARWRESISDLVRLLGYRLSPAVGGNAVFAFELKKEEPVTIPAGFPLKASLEKVEKPAEFETKDEITAYPSLGKFNLYRPLIDGDITPQTTEFYISSPEQLSNPIDLKVGDRLLVGNPEGFFIPGWGGSLANAEIVIVDSIREQHGRKYYTIKGKLKRSTNTSALYVHKLGRTFHHFGYNSPSRIVDTDAPVTSSATVNGQTTTTSSSIEYVNVTMGRPVNTTYNSFSGNGVEAVLSDVDFPLDSEVKDLPNYIPIIVQAAFTYPMQYYILGQPLPITTLVRMISDVRTVTITWGGVSGTVSQVRLNDKLSSSVGNNASMGITDALFHEVLGPAFAFKRAKQETSVISGNRLFFYGTFDEVKILLGRRLMLEAPNADPQILTVISVPTTAAAGTETYRQLYPIDLSADVDYGKFPNDSPTVTVYGNIVDADEGKTMPEVPIGSGDPTQVFQNFKLPKPPLTYHIVPANTPSETPELEIYVNDRQWKQVDSFFDKGGDEQIYIVREDADGNSWVQFGDGKTGARLTQGVDNVKAIFRMGSGAFGPLKADSKVQASAKLKNLDKIWMPSGATGGAPAEDGQNAKNAAPGKIQSLGRIVSLKDFESEALAIAGVELASASWQLVDNLPSVVVVVLMETGRESEIAAVRDTLNAYNTERGAARHAIEVLPGERKYVTTSVDLALKATYRMDLVEPAIRRALGVSSGKPIREEDQTGLFSVKKRRFGGSEYVSTVEGTVQNVEGVLWARAKTFASLTDPDASLPTSISLDHVIGCAPEQILNLSDKHLFLSAVAEGGK